MTIVCVFPVIASILLGCLLPVLYRGSVVGLTMNDAKTECKIGTRVDKRQ